MEKLKVQAELNFRCFLVRSSYYISICLCLNTLVRIYNLVLYGKLCLHVVVQSEFQLKAALRDCQNKATN